MDNLVRPKVGVQPLIYRWARVGWRLGSLGVRCALGRLRREASFWADLPIKEAGEVSLSRASCSSASEPHLFLRGGGDYFGGWCVCSAISWLRAELCRWQWCWCRNGAAIVGKE